MAHPDIYDVAIIGFGPVGATLAALLGRRQLRVAVFDKEEQVYPLPRACALDHEAMRTFQEAGITEALAPYLMPYRPSLYLGVDGKPIQHFDMGDPPHVLGWSPFYAFNQPALEAVLREQVAQLSSVQVRLGHEVTDVHVEDDGLARLTVQAPSGIAEQYQARYVVACDGGRSPTRQRLGLTLKSLNFDEPWVVVDMHVNQDMLARLPQTNIQYCNAERPCTYVVLTGNHRRWEFLLRPDEASQRELSKEVIWQMLSPWLQPHEASIWRAATYRFHAVVLNPWRKGPILVAGDAAHQMPPFLAQGMCQGLRDVANLAWKLDWVLSGRADDAFLDSYGQERAPQVEEITALVKRLGKIICELDPEQAKARDQQLRDAQGGQVRMQLRQSLLPGIRHGLVHGTAEPVGMPFPQPFCTQAGSSQPQRMDECVPRDMLLVLRHAPDPNDWAAWASALSAMGVHCVCLGAEPGPKGVLSLQEEENVLARWFEQYGCDAALVRPDHVVFGIATWPQLDQLLVQAKACFGLTKQAA